MKVLNRTTTLQDVTLVFVMVLPEANKNVYLSARNLQKAECIIAANVNTYKVLNADVMVITENSLKAIDGVLG